MLPRGEAELRAGQVLNQKEENLPGNSHFSPEMPQTQRHKMPAIPLPVVTPSKAIYKAPPKP